MRITELFDNGEFVVTAEVGDVSDILYTVCYNLILISSVSPVKGPERIE